MKAAEEEALVTRAFARTKILWRAPELEPDVVVIDLTTPEGRAACLEAEQRSAEQDAAFARDQPPAPEVFICSKCGGARSGPDGPPHAPHAGDGPNGPAYVDCVGDVIDPWPPVGSEPRGGPHGP